MLGRLNLEASVYRSGDTIFRELEKISRKTYVLPAIQRDFIWKPHQIASLFDSLMQGYPMGTFLFWRILPETSEKFRFYEFAREYNERDAAHSTPLPTIYNQEVMAVLDGQQRLTALNIGLNGHMAMKLSHKRWNNPDAFPRTYLYLNLIGCPEKDDTGTLYEFKFLQPSIAEDDTQSFWFRVSNISGMPDAFRLLSYIQEYGSHLPEEQRNKALNTLSKLHSVIFTQTSVHYFEETSQDIERVLNIFIRLNAGGTKLTYSDLLLSVAVAQWQGADARQVITDLVERLNNVDTAGFHFNKDFVLKAGLMLINNGSVGFKVENFNRNTTSKLQENWDRISNALIRTVQLVSSLGFTEQSLRASSSLLPISYYLYIRNAGENYLTSNHTILDRESIRLWLTKSLLKSSGIWGSGLDTLLTALRDVFNSNQDTNAFPRQELEDVMRRRGKSLDFEPVEIEELLDISYGDSRIFGLMALLFPFTDLSNRFHIDHIFPASALDPRKLQAAHLEEDTIERLAAQRNMLPNLQLLDGTQNVEKQDTMPLKWLENIAKPDEWKKLYIQNHCLGTLPNTVEEFESFFQERRVALKKKLFFILSQQKEIQNSL